MRGPIALALVSSLALAAAHARAEPTPGGAGEAPQGEATLPASGGASGQELSAAYRRLARPPGGVAHLMASLALGKGLRFNNPYRLQTQLGETGESLSLTSTYLDLGAAAAFGSGDGLQHGAALRLSIGLGGVAQQSLTPSYLLAYRASDRVLAFGRLGAAILTMPDPNVGGELGLGINYFVTARVAITGELVGDLFYGAATWEKSYTVYPVVSAQLGLMVDHELLP